MHLALDKSTALEKLNKLFTVIGKESRNNLKLSIMAPGPITSWEIDGETVEAVSGFTCWAPKSLQKVIEAMELKDSYSLEGVRPS